MRYHKHLIQNYTLIDTEFRLADILHFADKTIFRTLSGRCSVKKTEMILNILLQIEFCVRLVG